MGTALDSLSDATTVTRENPKLLLYAFALTVALMLASLVLSFIPFGSLLISFGAAPFFMVAMTGLTYAAYQSEPVTIPRFREVLSDHFVDVTLAFLLVYALMMVATFIAFILGAILFVAFVGMTATPETTGTAMQGLGALTMIPMFLIGGIYMAVYLVLTALMQFVDVGTIIGGHDEPMAVLKHSAGILRDHPISVTGYLTVRGFVGAVPSFLAMGLFLVAAVVSSEAIMYALMLLGVLAFLIGLPIATVFGFAYHVAYYSKLPSTPSPEQDDGNSVIEV